MREPRMIRSVKPGNARNEAQEAAGLGYFPETIWIKLSL